MSGDLKGYPMQGVRTVYGNEVEPSEPTPSQRVRALMRQELKGALGIDPAHFEQVVDAAMNGMLASKYIVAEIVERERARLKQ